MTERLVHVNYLHCETFPKALKSTSILKKTCKNDSGGSFVRKAADDVNSTLLTILLYNYSLCKSSDLICFRAVADDGFDCSTDD